MIQVPFSKPFITGKELTYIEDTFKRSKLSGNGFFTRECEKFFEKEYGAKRALLTTSCTDALELAALLVDIRPGDEVIIPSFTFVSTANAFVLRGAKIVFCDSLEGHPNMDPSKIETLITPNTKAIVPVHYGGVACEMNAIMALAKKYQLYVIEDAAQAIDSQFEGKQLGTIGHFGAFSFHDTKNISAGEGGALLINSEEFIDRAEIIREKGTDRSLFIKGQVDKYGWQEVGSSFLPSELNAAFLMAQLESIETIQSMRLMAWKRYCNEIKATDVVRSFEQANCANAHVFFLIFKDSQVRDEYLTFMKSCGVQVTFHFQPLERSPFVIKNYPPQSECKNSIELSETLVRLPLFAGIKQDELTYVIEKTNDFFLKRSST